MNNFKLNKGISTPIGILIVVICALLAGGILAWQYWWAPREEIKLPEVEVPEGEISEEGIPEEIVEEETADWKIYRNEEYGFETKYPRDEIIHYEGKTEYIIQPFKVNFRSFLITIWENSKKLEIKDYFLEESACVRNKPICEYLRYQDGLLEKIKIGDVEWFKPESEKIRQVFISATDNKYIINFLNRTLDEKTFKQILSTFRFIEREESTVLPTEKYSFEKQQVGEPADGLGLKSIRHADHEDYYRIVFDITGQDDLTEAYTIPVAQAFYSHSAKLITLEINGIRKDFTGNEFEEPVMINDEVVASYIREKIYDDSAIAYTIALNRNAKFYLHTLTNPVRIIVDIEK